MLGNQRDRKVSLMGHLQHPQVSGIATINQDEIVINFSDMPLGRLAAMRRLGEGMSAKSCDNWRDAATPAAKALGDYLDQDLGPIVNVDLDSSLTITVSVNTGGASSIYQAIRDFFAREGIVIEVPTGVRSR